MENVTSNIELFFRELNFNQSSHTYNVGNLILPSVSGLIKDFTYPFERMKIANNVAIKKNINVQEVLDSWDNTAKEACDRGHRVHDFGENYVWDRSLIPSCGQEQAVVKFWNDIPEYIVPVIMELKMYHKHYHYAGTGDIILYNKKTSKFIIADYKTNKDLFKNFKDKRLKYPFNFLKDCPYNKYQLQLSFYQILFEQTDYIVESRKLIWLLPDGNYKMYDTENYTLELKQYLASRN